MTRLYCSRFGCGVVLSVLCAGLALAPAIAQDKAASLAAPSLQWVPADAGTYSAMLRTGEQLHAIRQSKAWARLWSMPAVKMAWQMVTAEWANSSGKLAQVRAWYEQPDNAALLSFLGELFEEEVFSFSGKNSADMIKVLQQLQMANQFAPFMAMIKDGPAAANQPGLRVKAILQVLAANESHLKISDAVMGFKLSRTKPAQIAKWLAAGEKSLAQLAPPLADRFKTIKVHGANVHTLTLDGEMIPWEMVNLTAFEDQPGEYDKLIKRLKETKLTIAVTVRGGYVLVSLGEGTAGLEACSDKLSNRLAGRTELEPLAKFADRRITSISYTSKEYATAFSGDSAGAALTAQMEGLLKDSGLPADKQAKIAADLKGLTAGLKLPPPPQPGASLSFAFLSKRGTEDYSYNWSKSAGSDSTKPLTLLTHVGSQPLAFAVARAHGSPDGYKLLVRLIKLGHQYFDDLALPKLPDHVKQPYEAFMEDARPLFARLDEATGNLLLPSLDGQIGLVLDAKLTSRQWFKMMPMANRQLPFPEIALILGVKDSAKFRKAFQEYREVANGLIQAVSKLAPGQIPNATVPEPKVGKIKSGTLYGYPLPPELGIDQRIAPTAGLSKNVAVFSMSPVTVQRLLVPTLRKDLFSPIAKTDRPLLSAGYFDWAGVVDAATPWLDFGLTLSKQKNDVTEQVQTALEILKVFRSYASATYMENGVTVRHGEAVFRDLDR